MTCATRLTEAYGTTLARPPSAELGKVQGVDVLTARAESDKISLVRVRF